MKNYTIKELFKGIKTKKVIGDKGVRVTGISLDSRKIIPGTLFFALKGLKQDGNIYISEALSRGAVGVVTDSSIRAMNKGVAIQVEDARRVLAEVSKRFFNAPDEQLKLIGITGTNGKTTVATLVQYLLNSEKNAVGLLGTVSYNIGTRSLPSSKTTPESLDSFNMLDQMRQAGCKAAAVEVTSHGIEMKRIHGMNFNVGAFLNLTQDHLDFHNSMEEYYLSKKKFFTGETANELEQIIINIDDLYGKRLYSELSEKERILTFGISEEATFSANDIYLDSAGICFNLVCPEGEIEVKSMLLGKYNVLNILAALTIGYAYGGNVKAMVSKIESFAGVPGRMEVVRSDMPFNVVVDYAHTDDALKNGLEMLRQITKQRLFVVYGCGGNRDASKRPKMTAVVQEYADFAWATADNPRKEKMEDIFEDMKKGVTKPEQIAFVHERRQAIQKAIDEAAEGDCVLIAGKGHEAYQELADTVIPFDDRKIAGELLEFKKTRKILQTC